MCLYLMWFIVHTQDRSNSILYNTIFITIINKTEILSENIDVCTSSPCQNGGTCVHGINYTTTYICKCDVGYVGQNCTKGIFIIAMLLTQNVPSPIFKVSHPIFEL